MKILLSLEEAAMFALSLFALYYLDAEWWYYLLIFVGPDISMIGYSAGNKAGAVTYNFFHHKAIAIGFILLGVYLENYMLEVIGIILFGHSSMDRMLGYGLKLERGFNYTHLGLIGKNAKKYERSKKQTYRNTAE